MNKNLRINAMALLAALSVGCGDGKNGAPDGSTIIIDPSSLTVGPVTADDCGWSTPSIMRIFLRDKAGNPLNDIALTIDSSGPVEIYANPDNDEYFNFGEQPAPSTFIAMTGAFGAKNIFISAQYGGANCGPLDYSTDLAVYSGTASARATIKGVSGAAAPAP